MKPDSQIVSPVTSAMSDKTKGEKPEKKSGLPDYFRKKKIPVPGNQGVLKVQTPVEEDFYADSGLSTTPLKSVDVPSAEEMAKVAGVGLPAEGIGATSQEELSGQADSDGELVTPTAMVDRASEAREVVPFDALSVSSDVDEVKSDMMVFSNRLKDYGMKMTSIEGELNSLRYDVNTISTQLGELVRAVERMSSVEQDIQEREERDVKLSDDITSKAATLQELAGSVDKIRQQHFTRTTDIVSAAQAKKVRKHRE